MYVSRHCLELSLGNEEIARYCAIFSPMGEDFNILKGPKNIESFSLPLGEKTNIHGHSYSIIFLPWAWFLMNEAVARSLLSLRADFLGITI